MSFKPQTPLADLKSLALTLPDFTSPLSSLLSLTEIKDKVMCYFHLCISDNTLPTMTGLARTLNTTRHELLSSYNSDPLINSVITKSKQVITEHVEKLLLSGRPPIGLIFWLKNNDNWIDRTEIVKNDKTMAEILQDLEKDNSLINQSNPLNQISNDSSPS